MSDELVELLELQPLPHEGGLFHRTYGDDYSSAIYYLLRDNDFSALHLLTAVEVYHFYAGDPVRLLLLDPATGSVSQPVLGTNFAAGERPQLVVPAGVWQGSSSAGQWSLIGTTMAPGYTDDMFTLGDRAALQAEFPAAADRIAELTR